MHPSCPGFPTRDTALAGGSARQTQDPAENSSSAGQSSASWGPDVEAAQRDGLPCTNPLALTLTGPDRSCLGRPVRALSAVRLRYGKCDAGSLAQPVIFES